METFTREKGYDLVFEDALHALKTAQKAGFVTVGVYDAYSEEKQPEMKASAQLYLRDYKNLAALDKQLS